MLDLVVFGKAAGEEMIGEVKSDTAVFPDPPNDAADLSRGRLGRLDVRTSGQRVVDVQKDLRRAMQNYCGVFRFPDDLDRGIQVIKEVAERAKRIYIEDKSKIFNTARIEALEVENLVEVAMASMISAHARTVGIAGFLLEANRHR